jgi:hypothetical protein
MRSRVPRPWALVALLALASLAGVAALGGEGGAVPVDKSTCWRCHATWTPPLRQGTSALLLPGEGAAPGGGLQAALQVRNAWLADIVDLTIGVDLSQAPSLAFRSSTPPLHTNATLLLQPDATQPLRATQAGTQVNLTASPSDSRVRIVPLSKDPLLGPQLAANLTYPDGHVVRRLAPARGAAIDLPHALDGVVGPVRIAVELPGASASGNLTTLAPPTAPVQATVQVDAGFDYAALRQVHLGFPVALPRAGGIVLRGFNFTVLQAPAAGELVRFEVNSTAHYRHSQPTGTGDWANWTQAPPLDVPVALQAGRVRLAPATVEVAPPALVNGPTMTTVGESVGYASAFLIVSSIASGGMFGKASRRGMNHLFGSAKRRVAFHNVLSYGLILAALAHMALFLVDGDFKWTRGILWGGASMLGMLGLGVTGALQVPLVRRWGFAGWRWTHYGMAAAVIALTLAHMMLEGTHFGPVQQALRYTDPFAPSR